MATIKPIEGRSVHQIQSGQVIVDLCSVVKELVENSLDAGATNIEVRFKNQGLESIEVQDNGDGISPKNYETLALKHHTSKLSSYSDLTTLQTFGFRGEALSSLCALSQFSVVTCLAADAPKGAKLDFEVSGKLKSTSVVAAQRGTTVTIENLFNNLPVRRRELEKKIKTEWNRVIGVLGQYACIQTGIKFSVTQQTSNAKAKKTTLFSTKGNPTTRENIVNVFGAKTLTALVPLDLNLDLEPTSAPSQRWSTQEDGGKKEIRVIGHISRPASGEGRQTPDRQMFFVNGRPCGLPQFAKAINEVYKSYNASQSPFIFANIELDTHLYDVNVSPDKRTIMLHEQTRMLENLKTSLTALFETQDYTVPISQLPAQRQPSYKQLTIVRENSALIKSPQVPGAPSASVEPTDTTEEPEGHIYTTDNNQNTEDEGSHISHNPKSRHSAVSRESMSKDREAVSLITSWVGRKAEDRVDDQAAPPQVSRQQVEGLSREKRRLVEKLAKEGEKNHESVDPEDVDATTQSTQESSITSTSKTPLPVVDFNKRLAELRNGREPTPNSHDCNLEPQIPALSHGSPASSPARSSIFSSSVRSQRPPPAVATITIGAHTVTSSIGTPCPKRQRIDNTSGTSQRHTNKSPAGELPSFGSRLSQRFGTAGTAELSALSEDDEIEDEGQFEPREPDPNGQPSDVNQDVELQAASDSGVRDDDDGDETSSPEVGDDDSHDDEYLDDVTKKIREEAKVVEMIQAAEDEAANPSQDNIARTKVLLKGGAKKKDSTVQLIQTIDASVQKIETDLKSLEGNLDLYRNLARNVTEETSLDSAAAEEKLSLTISKTDFARMKIIGQFNLGFIIASRGSASQNDSSVGKSSADDMFIIDQHASDEKFNFERLQATTIIQSQRLVQPKTLNLTAVEEEIVMENLAALETNGFIVTVDNTGEAPVGERCKVISLPTSRETTFSITDLNELISLLSDHPPGSIPRPSRARKMFAMRACRSSIMIGKTLTHKQMGSVVKHMGEIDKPWNCPHGRPTMRHLCGLASWDELGWKEGGGLTGEETPSTDWAAYVRQAKEHINEDLEPETGSEPEADVDLEVSE
ncbi:DNA mismatch repair protein MutL [Phlyctema vagabunda]|uniref:DNA mismatch repair protein MutL n=1 Tax=Phlyctema vagabunda TaxID=108571 RepID=A0ABR4P4W8_9HELO